MSARKVIRFRKTHTKTKTGCRTCKLRHKRCDETRPVCNRCTSTGRKCEGFPYDSSALTAWTEQLKVEERSLPVQPALSVEITPLMRKPCGISFQSDRERYCFSFFWERTGRELLGYFGSTFWRSPVLASLFHNEPIRQAILTVGAVHRRFELGITPEAFEYCEFAQKSYTSVLTRLRTNLERGGQDLSSELMIVPMLLYVYEMFQGDANSARTHLKGWLGVHFSRHPQVIETSVDRHHEDANDSNMDRLFCDLEKIITSTSPEWKAIHVDTHLVRLAEVQFCTLQSARNCLFKIVRYYLGHIQHHASPEDLGRVEARACCNVAILRWNCALAEYLKTLPAFLPRTEEIIVRALRLYRQAASLMLLMHSNLDMAAGPKKLPEAAVPVKQSINGHFARIKYRKELLEKSLSSAILCETALNFNHQVAAKGANSQQHQDIWRDMGVYGVAELLAAEEESLIMSVDNQVEDQKIISKDITLYMEERKLVMLQCVSDPLDGVLVWTQQWCTL